jgi:hypothetical protein
MTDLDHKDKEEDNDKTLTVTKYFTMPVSGKKQSLWWEGFEIFVPSQHPNLYFELLEERYQRAPPRDLTSLIITPL